MPIALTTVMGPGRVKTRVLAVNTRILEKCILQLDAVSASSAAVSDLLRKHFRFGCSAHEFSHGLGQNGKSHSEHFSTAVPQKADLVLRCGERQVRARNRLMHRSK